MGRLLQRGGETAGLVEGHEAEAVRMTLVMPRGDRHAVDLSETGKIISKVTWGIVKTRKEYAPSHRDLGGR